MQKNNPTAEAVENIEAVRKWISVVNLYPVVVSDQENRILLVNEAAVKLWGKPEKELLGKDLEILKSSTVDLTENERRAEAVKSQGFYTGYLIIRTFKGIEYLTKQNIHRVALPDSEFCYISQFISETRKNLNDFKDFVRIKNEIFINLGNVSDVKQLEKLLEINYRRILFLFKKFEGTPPKKYLNDMKIERCIRLLRDGRYKYREIADALGFCDVSHLSNSFKEKTGKTLNECRKGLSATV